MSALERIFNTLVLYHYNMKVLHWKVKGLDFDDKHKLASDYYEKLDDFIDEIAEIMLMLGNSPKNLKTILDGICADTEQKYLLVDCENMSYYTGEQMIASINLMFNHLISLYETASNDGSLSGDIVSKLQEHQYYLRLENNYKGRNRMMR